MKAVKTSLFLSFFICCIYGVYYQMHPHGGRTAAIFSGPGTPGTGNWLTGLITQQVMGSKNVVSNVL